MPKVALGEGYDRIKNVTTSRVVESTTVPSQESGVTPSISFHLVTQEQSLSHAFSTALSLDVTIPLASFSVGVDFEKQTRIEDNSAYLVCIIVVQKKTEALDTAYKFDSTAENDIKQTDDITKIARQYGDSFCYESVYGSACYLFLEMVTHDEALAQTLKTHGNVKFGNIGALKTCLEKTKKFREKSGYITGNADSIGLPKNLKDNLFPESVDKVNVEFLNSLTRKLMECEEMMVLGSRLKPLKDAARGCIAIRDKLLSLEDMASNTITVRRELHQHLFVVKGYLEAISIYEKKFGAHETSNQEQSSHYEEIQTKKVMFETIKDKLIRRIEDIKTAHLVQDKKLSSDVIVSPLLPTLLEITLTEQINTLKKELEKLFMEWACCLEQIEIDPADANKKRHRCSNFFSFTPHAGNFHFKLCFPSEEEKRLFNGLSIHFAVKKKVWRNQPILKNIFSSNIPFRFPKDMLDKENQFCFTLDKIPPSFSQPCRIFVRINYQPSVAREQAIEAIQASSGSVSSTWQPLSIAGASQRAGLFSSRSTTVAKVNEEPLNENTLIFDQDDDGTDIISSPSLQEFVAAMILTDPDGSMATASVASSSSSDQGIQSSMELSFLQKQRQHYPEFEDENEDYVPDVDDSQGGLTRYKQFQYK